MKDLFWDYPKTIETSSWPLDYQELLFLLHNHHGKTVPDSFSVVLGNLDDYQYEVLEQYLDYTTEDLKRIREYTEMLLETPCPPLISGGPKELLIDGCHRFIALRILGYQHCPMIYLPFLLE